MEHSVYSQIPKMDRLLALPAVQEAAKTLPRQLVRQAAEQVLSDVREALRQGAPLPSQEELQERVLLAIRKAAAWRLRPVVNATGVVLHTNLGRAPLGAELADHVARTAGGYSTLEYDLESGGRGSRYALVEQQLCRITGAEAAMVVNNNAAAVFLMLHALCAGRGVAVSRGELVEIGGAFRVPEIMAASGASLLEVGTTNKTRLSDYRAALDRSDTAALLKVHTSNFKIVGFSEEASLEELAELAKERGLPLLYDLGAGFLIRPEALGLHEGVYVPDAVRYADVCCFSGDKLFGGAQAGIVLGRKEFIDRMKRDQLARMLRVDKMTLAATEAVLQCYEDPMWAKDRLPVLQMLACPEKLLREKAETMASQWQAACPKLQLQAVSCTDEPGGGSLPGLELPGWAVAVSGASPDSMEKTLRSLDTPVIARIFKNRLLLSVRTLLPEDGPALLEAMKALEAML